VGLKKGEDLSRKNPKRRKKTPEEIKRRPEGGSVDTHQRFIRKKLDMTGSRIIEGKGILKTLGEPVKGKAR